MQKFIRRTKLFIFGYIIYLITIYCFNNLVIKYKNFDFSNLNVLILGDSHAGTSLNPDYFKNSKNISLNSESYIPSYLKLKLILQRCTIDTVLLSFSPHNLSGSNDLKFSDKWNKLYYYRYYSLFSRDILITMNFNLLEYLSIYIEKMFLFPNVNHLENLIGSFNKVKNNLSNLSIEEKKLSANQRLERHYFNKGELLHISNSCINYLDSIVTLCRSKNIELFLISPPIHSMYFNSIPKLFQDAFLNEKARLENMNQTIYDYTNETFDDSLFADINHLNFNGANVFSNIIRKRLRD